MTTIDTQPVPGTLVDTTVLNLQARVEELLRQVDRLRTENERLRSDIQIIATKLRDEAMNRQWCSEYGEFIDEVNDQTWGDWLEHCEFTRQASFRITVTYTVRDGSSRAEDIKCHLADFSGYDEADIGDVSIVLVGDEGV